MVVYEDAIIQRQGVEGGVKGKFVRRFVQKRRGVTFMYTRNKEGSVGSTTLFNVVWKWGYELDGNACYGSIRWTFVYMRHKDVNSK